MGYTSTRWLLLATKANFDRTILAPTEYQPLHPLQTQLVHAPNCNSGKLLAIYRNLNLAVSAVQGKSMTKYTPLVHCEHLRAYF